jgi:hypothetical protein
LAVLDFLSARISVSGRATFDHAGNERLVAADADLLEYSIERLAGGSDERLATTVFFSSRGLADQHDPTADTPAARDGMRPLPSQFGASGAGADLLGHLV